jgi:glycosyltransferase involved in cell wall biosynthesis
MHKPLTVNTRFRSHRITGVERYAAELLGTLNGYAREIHPRSEIAGLRAHLWEQLVLPALLPAGTRLWSPANTGPLAVNDQVITVHDASPMDHPEWFKPFFAAWYRRVWARLLPRAAGVVTSSEFSRRRLLAHFPLDERRLRVVPGGVGPRFGPVSFELRQALRRRYGLPERFVLFVGTLEPRKNLPRLLEAWQLVRQGFPQVGLALAGTAGRVFPRLSLPVDLPGVFRLGYIPEADLPALYGAAEAFILPSLYEGFGLTLLESMACGTPVVYARSGAMPEVAGVAGLAFDPLDVREMAAALSTVLAEPELRWQLSAAGRERVRQFTWERAGRLFQDAIESL